jgi:Sec-independent protein translocase protein TatA
MMGLPEFAYFGLIILGVLLIVLLVLAPLKLYSIDRTLKKILEELRLTRASSGGSLADPTIKGW